MFVADPASVHGSSATICYVVEGQVAVAVFDAGDLQQRRAEQERHQAMTEDEREELSLLPPPPLARLAKKNLAVFMEGDLFNAKALNSIASDQPVAFYTVGPSVVAVIDNTTMAHLAGGFPFFEARFRRAIERARAPERRHRRQAGAARLLRAPGHLGRPARACACASSICCIDCKHVRGGLRGPLRRPPPHARRLPARACSTSSTPAARAPISAASIRARTTRSSTTRPSGEVVINEYDVHRLHRVRAVVPVPRHRHGRGRGSRRSPTFEPAFKARLEKPAAR